MSAARLLRIAFLTPEYVSEPKFDGGLANYLYRVARILSEQGHEPEIFVYSDRNETIVHDGIVVHRCTAPRSLLLLHSLQRRVFRRWLSYMDVISKAWALARAFQRRQSLNSFDIVEASNFMSTGLFLGRSSPPVVTRVSYVPWLWLAAANSKIDFNSRLVFQLHNLNLRRSAAVYGPCAAIAKHITKTVGVPVDVLHPPLFMSTHIQDEDPSEWAARLFDTRYILFFGRICAVKGVDVLAEAIRPILASNPDLKFVMVGRAESSDFMQAVLARLSGVMDQVIHIGRLPHRKLFPIIRNAQFVVLPSRVDNFPNTCVEAMGVGQVVLGTSGIGFEDLITSGVNGVLTRPDDVAELRKSILHALRMSPAELAELRSNAEQRISSVKPEDAVHDLIHFYWDALNSKKGAFRDSFETGLRHRRSRI